MSKIFRNSEHPLYKQLAEVLESRATSGDFVVGKKLPSEAKLTEEFDVSRITVRQALAHMEKRGLIVRRRGKGTFLSAPHVKQQLNREAKTIVEALREKGIEPDITILGLEQIEPDDYVREALGGINGLVTCLRRVFTHNGAPIALAYLYLPLAMSGVAQVLTRDDHAKETTYSVFEDEMKIAIKEAKHIIRTIEVNDEAAEALNMQAGDACLTMDRITYAESGSVLELITFYYPTDTFQFEITLPRHDPSIAVKLS